jgi:hypothetical protein
MEKQQHDTRQRARVVEPGTPAPYTAGRGAGSLTGPLLALFRERHRLDQAQLASLLGCGEPDLAQLAVCERPRPESFAADVARVAAHVRASYGLLRCLYRETLESAPLPARLYRGWWADGDWHVTAGGKLLRSIGYSCPDGFAWGYDGSACSELALSLLRDHFREWYVTRAYLTQKGKAWARPPLCWQWLSRFEEAFVARWDMHAAWELTDAEIDAWLLEQALAELARGEQAVAGER